MSQKSGSRELRMDLLRTRAAIERAEVSAALQGMRAGTGRMRNLATVAGGISAAVAGRSGWMGLLATSVTGHPWLAALALGGVRALMKRPLLAVFTIGAVAIGMRVANKRPTPARRVVRRYP